MLIGLQGKGHRVREEVGGLLGLGCPTAADLLQVGLAFFCTQSGVSEDLDRGVATVPVPGCGISHRACPLEKALPP